MTAARQSAEEVARSSYGRLVAYLAAGTHDLAAAEDALGDAFVAALRTWPERGVPERPEAWLLTAARRTLIGHARRRDVAERALASVAVLLAEHDEARGAPPPAIPDKRLELLFTCAHPALERALHAPLMLQAVLGLDAARIGSAFLVAPSTMGQRLSRAKTKIRTAGIPYAVPPAKDLPARTASVLDAIYAAYGTGWDDPGGADPKRRGLTSEAIRLARMLAELRSGEAEAHGLLALLLHSDARRDARRDADGAFVPLADQDTLRWSPASMAEAERHLALAFDLGPTGPYALQAAIQSLHNRRALTGVTDWDAIVALYDRLVALQPTVGALVARAAGSSERNGPDAGLALLDDLDATVVQGYQPYWTVRAHLLERIGRRDEARSAAMRAIGLTADPGVRAYLLDRFGS